MTAESDKKLLTDFQPASYDEWREAAEKLLKGAPFEKRMLTKTPEGITLQPIYNLADIEDLPHIDSQPGMGDFVRGAHPDGYVGEAWHIAQEQPYADPQVFNATLLKDLNSGQSAVNLLLDAAGHVGLDPDEAEDDQVGLCGTSISRLDDLSAALEKVHAGYLPIYFQTGCSGLAIESMFLAWLEEQGIEPSLIKGGLGMDPFLVLEGRGKLPVDMEELFDELALLVQYNDKEMPLFGAAGISGMAHHSAGASSVEELAAMLSSGLRYLRAMDQRGIPVDVAAKQLRFTISIGSDFFMEVAKLRAARLLWARIVRELGGSPEAQRMRQTARTGLFNKTKLDPYVNMLRTTTEAFAAVAGGAESICVGPFDETTRLPDDFSRRIARNLQVILQEECELTTVIDPAGGSWYIEKLTDELGRKTWDLFTELEKEGGMQSALEKGTWQERLSNTRAGRENLLGQRRSSLIGTNQYPNLQEEPLDSEKPNLDSFRTHTRYLAKAQKATIDVGALRNGYVNTESGKRIGVLVEAVKAGATLGAISHIVRGDALESVQINALSYERLATRYEELRAAADKYREENGKAPQIFLANLGVLKRHKIRADFTRSFFAAGGFECIYSEGSEEDAAAVEAFLESGAKIAVICGRDDDYAERVPNLIKAIKEAAPDAKVVLAGHPGDKQEEYESAGLDDFIFIKSNNYEVNRSYLSLLGAI